MIKDKEGVVKFLVNYLKHQIIASNKDGFVIHLDGTLTSFVNALIVDNLRSQVKISFLMPVINQNKFATGHISNWASKLRIPLEFVDLSKDFETLGFHNLKNKTLTAQIAYSKRFLDLALHLKADQENLLLLSNLCYSQWIVGYPHINYQSHEQVNLLYRFFYSEIKELGKHLGMPEDLTEREPSFYLWSQQRDKDLLGFNYAQLEDFLRSTKTIRTEEESIISKRLIADNRNKFIGPLIQRPSSFLT